MIDNALQVGNGVRKIDTALSIGERENAMAIQFQPLLSVLERLSNAMNQLGPEVSLERFDPDYETEQLAHPDRQRADKDQASNSPAVFSSNPNADAEWLYASFENDLESTGWVWLLRDALHSF